MNVSGYPYINRRKIVAYMSIPKNLYNENYYYKVEDNRNYFTFNLMFKNFLIKKFIYYYSSSLYDYEIDNYLNVVFYEKRNMDNIIDSYYNNLSYLYYYQYQKKDGSLYDKYLKFKAIKDNKFIEVGDFNSYGDRCIQFYKIFTFNFK